MQLSNQFSFAFDSILPLPLSAPFIAQVLAQKYNRPTTVQSVNWNGVFSASHCNVARENRERNGLCSKRFAQAMNLLSNQCSRLFFVLFVVCFVCNFPYAPRLVAWFDLIVNLLRIEYARIDFPHSINLFPNHLRSIIWTKCYIRMVHKLSMTTTFSTLALHTAMNQQRKSSEWLSIHLMNVKSNKHDFNDDFPQLITMMVQYETAIWRHGHQTLSDICLVIGIMKLSSNVEKKL